MILLSFLGSCIGCRQGMMIDDTAARLSGQYVVQSYVVNGDTLFVSAGVNKIDVKEFYIFIDRKVPDSVYISTSFKRIGATHGVRFTKDVGVREVNGVFQLSASPDYEGSIANHTFYERSGIGKGGGAIINPPSPFPVTSDPTLEGVFIIAKKAMKE